MNTLLRDFGYGLRRLFKLLGFIAGVSLALDLDTPSLYYQAPVWQVFSRLICGAEAGESLCANFGCGDFAALVKRVAGSGSGGPADSSRSEGLPEPRCRKPGIPDDLPFREGVDRIVPWNHHNPHTVAPDPMPGFANVPESRFPQREKGGLMIDPGQFGPGPWDGDHRVGNPGPQTGRQVRTCLEVFADRVAEVGQRLHPRGAPAATSGEFVTPTRQAFFGFDPCHRVIHGLRVVHPAGSASR